MAPTGADSGTFTTMRSTGTSWCCPGCRSTAASIGFRGYEAPGWTERRRLGVGDQHPARRDAAVSGMPHAHRAACAHLAGHGADGDRRYTGVPAGTGAGRGCSRRFPVAARHHGRVAVRLRDRAPRGRVPGADRMRALAVLACAIALPAMPALAHEGQVHGVALPWTFDPWIVVPLSISAAVYALGVGHLAQRSDLRRRAWEHLCYVAGWLALATALVSPLHWLGEHLFPFHMIEHEIVMAVAAPLLVMARPLGPLLWALSKPARLRFVALSQSRAWRGGWNALTQPGTATTL